jgi:beta-glucosidase
MNKSSILAATVALIIANCAYSASTENNRPWIDSKRSPDERAAMVLKQMSRSEKIAMVNGTFGASRLKANPAEQRIGAGWVAGVPRLGIPDLFESDASLGVANGSQMRKGDVATALPSSLATAASFARGIARAGGAMIGAETRAKGFNVLLAGGADLIRDPWNGRNFEYYSEDVLLTGELAGQAIAGIQSNDIVSTTKHYALNAQESGRNILDARLDEKSLRESDLLAFQIAIEKGDPGSVMCGYNQVNGNYACESSFLLNRVLKGDWHYPGWVMSDWGAVHSTVKAAAAGLDQESGQEIDRLPFFRAPLEAAVAGGELPEARLDDMVHRILRTMFAHGLIDRPTPATPQPIDYAAHAKVALSAAEAGLVLLKNEKGLLPLTSSVKRILVVGGHADVGVLSGGGSSQVRAVGGTPLELPMVGGYGPLSHLMKVTYHGSAPLTAIKAQATGADVQYVDGNDVAAATAAAGKADAVIVFGEQWRTEAYDVESLDLPGAQGALIDAISTANPHTIVVLESGGAVTMPWRDRVGAIVEAWYPGERGGEAIAHVLFGVVNPSGRLPITFPQSMVQAPRPKVPGIEQVKAAAAAAGDKPIDLAHIDLSGGVASFPVDYPEAADVGYRWYERKHETPLYSFGFGLSYTSFAYSDLVIKPGNSPSVSFTVKNTGARSGADVPQLYAASAGAVKRLVGFERVQLDPGEQRRVTMTIDPRLLAQYDTAAQGWRVASGTATIMLGSSALSTPLTATLELTAQRIAP